MKKAVQNRLPPEAREAIRSYLRNHAKQRAVSTFEAVQEVRRRFPGLATSDADLTDCIAGTAITLDLMIAFDSRAIAKLRQPTDAPTGSAILTSSPRMAGFQASRPGASTSGV